MTAVDFIDVSEHQGAIDWAAVPCPAIIKATEGRTFTDRRFATNMAAAGATGKLLGCYHFLTSTSHGGDQAAHFLDTVGAPVLSVLDWETDTTGTLPDPRVAQQFFDYFRHNAPDRTLVLYGNAPRRPFATLNSLPFWCAWYPPADSLDLVERYLRQTDTWAWQWSSDDTVPGITGRVDVNKFLATPPAMEGQPMTITDDDLRRIRAFCGLDPVPTRDYADDGSFTETDPLPVVQLAANAHIEAQLASLAADRANATANTVVAATTLMLSERAWSQRVAVVVAQLRREWDDLHLTTVPAVSHDALVAAVKQALRELFTA